MPPFRRGVDASTLGGPQGRRRRLRAVALALLLLVAGFLVGRLAARSEPGTVVLPAGESSPVVAPSQSAEGPVPRSERTPKGAARAAAQALSSLADARLLTDRDRRRAVVARIAGLPYRAELEPLFERTYEYLNDTLGRPAEDGEAVLRMTPVGYRVDAFAERRASVAVWHITLLATPERTPIAAWATSRAELVWSGGRWMVERFGVDTPGPTPGVTAPVAATAPGEFVALARGLSPFAP